MQKKLIFGVTWNALHVLNNNLPQLSKLAVATIECFVNQFRQTCVQCVSLIRELILAFFYPLRVAYRCSREDLTTEITFLQIWNVEHEPAAIQPEPRLHYGYLQIENVQSAPLVRSLRRAVLAVDSRSRLLTLSPVAGTCAREGLKASSRCRL